MSRCTSVSRNAIWLFLSTSMVKWIVCCCEFMCKRRLLTLDLVVTMDVSSTTIFFPSSHDVNLVLQTMQFILFLSNQLFGADVWKISSKDVI